MTQEERNKAIEEMTNDIVNNMSMAEMMAIVVERAKRIAELKVDGAILLHHPKEEFILKDSFWGKVKDFFKRKKKHKGFATKR
jgi:hypothetical protein